MTILKLQSYISELFVSSHFPESKIQKNSSFSSGDRPLLVYKLQCSLELNSDRCAIEMFEDRISSKSYSVGIKMC